MHILLTNDDGIFAPGIATLARHIMEKTDHRLSIIAPEVEQSGKSRAITLFHSMALKKVQIPSLMTPAYSVSGTPADCVRVGLRYLLQDVDLVLSGINFGVNVGGDVPYSGTVSAALEAARLEKPAIAVSAQIAGQHIYFDTAAEVILNLLETLPPSYFSGRTVLSVNTPALPYDQIKGLKAINCDAHITDEYEWVGSFGEEEHIRICNRYPDELEVETDLYYVRAGYATISPLSQIVSTDAEMALLSDWLQD
ncbi:5'/3'-nucleotidase SurE [Peptococcus simiae]|uniref:5'/3'-nucleotidase SurE n=1 Tax=Peptococcus simiae TaxID=1643805 RepID=UPI0039814B6F